MVADKIEQYLSTLRDRGLEEIEVAFFGGSFTGLSIVDQNTYLDVARRYKESGEIHKIRLSTRPDYIDKEILQNLKAHRVDIIELGVQSFDPAVLENSNRGHTAEDVYKACELIKEHNFQLGIQLMIGLPGDTKEKSMESARKTANLSPEFARLYPTVILRDTQLAHQYQSREYQPFSQEEMLSTVTEMYKILFQAGITILRVGLKSTDLVTQGTDLGGGYHPAFRQLVEGEIAREQMEEILQRLPMDKSSITFYSNERWFSAMIGHKACNKNALAEAYPKLEVCYRVDSNLGDGLIRSGKNK